MPRKILATLVAAFTLGACSGTAERDLEPDANLEIERTHRVEAERSYALVLYQFYQQRYFEALTETLVFEQGVTKEAAEKYPSFEAEVDKLRLLRGGMSLSYGLANTAEVLFSELLHDERRDPYWLRQRSRAWFYLGRQHYREKSFEAADSALAKAFENPAAIPDREMGGVADESLYLRVRIAQQQGDFERASTLITQLEAGIEFYYWAHYNQAAEQAAVQEFKSALTNFSVLEIITDDAEEVLLALRDRARTAKAFILLQQQDYEAAIAAFQGVRLNSPYADKALLGLGWSQMKRGELEKALVPWQQLQKGSPFSLPVQEAALALPYIYEQLGASAVALQAYSEAIEGFKTRRAALAEAELQYKTFDIQQLLRPTDSNFVLVERESADALSLSEADALLPDLALPYLMELAASTEFQHYLDELQSLWRLAQHQKRSAKRIEIIELVDSEQQTLWTRLLEQGELEALEARQKNVETDYRKWLESSRQARNDESGLGLLSVEEQQLWKRLDRAEENAERLKGTLSEQRYRDTKTRLSAVRGQLLWRAAQAFPAARWQAEKEEREFAKLIEENRRQQKTLMSRVGDKKNSAFASRISDLSLRNDQLASSISQAASELENKLRSQAIEQLQQQQRLLRGYQAQASVAMARLYDAKASERAPAGEQTDVLSVEGEADE